MYRVGGQGKSVASYGCSLKQNRCCCYFEEKKLNFKKELLHPFSGFPPRGMPRTTEHERAFNPLPSRCTF